MTEAQCSRLNGACVNSLFRSALKVNKISVRVHLIWIVPSEDTKCPSYFATADDLHKSVMANTPKDKQLQI